MSSLKVGFVGLGDQGAPMAEAISEAGYGLHVSLDASAVRERGLSGADGVLELTKWIEGTTGPDKSGPPTGAVRRLQAPRYIR